MAGAPFRKTYTSSSTTSSATTPSIKITNNTFSQQLLQRPPPAYATLPDRPRAAPMSIPNARESPPPPLPPPRYIDDIVEGGDPGFYFANRNRSDSNASAQIRPGSSLLGGSSSKSARSYAGPERNIDLGARDENLKSLLEYSREEERSESLRPQPQIPDLAALLEYNKLKSESHMGQKNLEKSSQAYDKHLLSRIGGPRTPPRTFSALSSSLNSNEDSPPQFEEKTLKKLNSQLRPLSMPERRHSDMGSSAAHRWGAGGRAPPSSAVSPGFPGLRSPLSEHGAERVLPSRTSTFAIDDTSSLSGRLSHRQSYDHSSIYNDADFAIGEHTAMSDLAIHDRSPSISDDMPRASRTGQKRRAQSPPSDSVIDPRLPGGNNGESWQKRSMHDASGRTSQAARVNANQASLSSTASSALKNGSYSSYGTSNPSTAATSYSDRPSPNFQTPENSVSSPRSSTMAHPAPPAPPPPPPPPPAPLQTGQPLHRRTTSSGILRAPGLFICGCCPKKPKKFETEEDLRVHEMEKQYICQYCHNRFKNKNEAERHQNSLHLRRHSWSCAALTSFEAAFHPTPSSSMATSLAHPSNPHHPHYGTSTDTCGYCGREFSNPPDWEARMEHLNRDHKFGECNQSKKFYRADHFRQHLKHSHAGSSGKWTNMLENACMKDEPPPQPMSAQGMPLPLHGIMVGPQGSYAAGGMMSGMQQAAQQAPMASMVSDNQAYPAQQQSPQAPVQTTPSQQQSPAQQQQHQHHHQELDNTLSPLQRQQLKIAAGSEAKTESPR